MRLENKRALITGGSKGIGRATAELFCKEGAKVAIVARNVDEGREAAASITRQGGKCYFWKMDVSNSAEVAEVIPQIVRELGGIDILVNNAGVYHGGVPIEEATEADYDKIMDIDVRGCFLCTKYVMPYMLAQGSGCIVNVSSINGIAGSPYHEHLYCMAKGAVTLLTKSIATSYAKQGIRCNSIHPCATATPMVSAIQNKSIEELEQNAIYTVQGRTASAMDQAYGILYLASDEARMVNGTQLYVDQGLLANIYGYYDSY